MAKVKQIAEYLVLYCFILLTNGCLVCGLLFTQVYTDLQHHQLEESVPAVSETVCAISCFRSGYDHCKMFSYINGTCGKYISITGNITQTPSVSSTPIYVHAIYFNTVATTTDATTTITTTTTTTATTATTTTTTTTTTSPTTTKPLPTCDESWYLSNDGRSCFLLSSVRVAKSWTSFRQHCIDGHPGANLASIRDQQDQDFLASYLTKSYPIGLNRVLVPDTWSWPDGSEPTSYTNWYPGHGEITQDVYVHVLSQAEDPNRGWVNQGDQAEGAVCEYFLSG